MQSTVDPRELADAVMDALDASDAAEAKDDFDDMDQQVRRFEAAMRRR